MKAFPRTDGKFNSNQKDEQGMDLRDWFAGLAMQTIIADAKGFDSSELVKFSYQMADLMIKARGQK